MFYFRVFLFSCSLFTSFFRVVRLNHVLIVLLVLNRVLCYVWIKLE